MEFSINSQLKIIVFILLHNFSNYYYEEHAKNEYYPPTQCNCQKDFKAAYKILQQLNNKPMFYNYIWKSFPLNTNRLPQLQCTKSSCNILLEASQG